VSATRVQNLYDSYMKPQYHGSDDSVDFVVRTDIRWKDVLVNENSTPTLVQMRDPNWTGYKWNHPSTYPEASEIDNMLQATCVQQGKCKVAVNLLIAATSGKNPPNFIANNSSWAWAGPGPSNNNVRVKWYNATARQYAENFTLAAMEHFDDPNISSWKLQEYFPGNSTFPSDYNQTDYRAGYATYLKNVEAGAPTDAHGDRVTMYQTNPILQSGVLEVSDFTSRMIGIADSDPQMFEEPTATSSVRPALHGDIPMAMGLDPGQFTRTEMTTFDGTANPWGYAGGTQHEITVPLVSWYYGRCGPIPMDQEFIPVPTIWSEFQPTLDQFGPGGSDYSSSCSPATDDWGGIPFDH
jgi:hypothetical protein